MADGKPDFSGVWRWSPGRYGSDITVDLSPKDIQPWADDLMKRRQENLVKDDPSNMYCLPQGTRDNLFPVHLAKIIQTSPLLVILSENLTYRQIFLDGRGLPNDPNPAFMGYSVGHWEGETLVVESSGFNDRTWLDFAGHPHSEDLRIVERFRRPDLGHLEIRKTYQDSKIYARPWTIAIRADLAPDTELLEYVCNENERDRAHLVGTASDGIDAQSVVQLTPDVLSRYVGAYEYHLPENPAPLRILQITLNSGQLIVEGNRPLIPLSATSFALTRGAVRFDFIIGNQGAANEVVVQRTQGCGGSSGVAASFACGETAGQLRLIPEFT